MAFLANSNNPILWQEMNHQVRAAPRMLRHGRIIWPVCLALSLVTVVLTLSRIDYPSRELALYTVWIVHVFVAVRAITAGANAISREHVGLTWDALILTGVSARQIMLGKWRAALRRAAPWMFALGITRLVLLPVFILALINRFAYRVQYLNANGSSYYYFTNFQDFSWLPLAMLLSVFGTIALTILEVLTCTALGLAASAVTRRGTMALIVAFCVRFTPVALFAAFTRYELGPARAYRVMNFPPFAIADSGTSPLAQLILPVMQWTRNTQENALQGLLLASSVMLVILVISLFAAWAAIRMTGALPHSKPEFSTVEG